VTTNRSVYQAPKLKIALMIHNLKLKIFFLIKDAWFTKKKNYNSVQRQPTKLIVNLRTLMGSSHTSMSKRRWVPKMSGLAWW